jgi:predicted amidophosphoribosyltransferase
VARRSVAFQTPPSWIQRAWAGRAGESLFSVLFPSDCRICGEPLLNISRLPVSPRCLDQMQPVRAKVRSICGERVLSAYAERETDGLRRRPVCRRIDRPFTRATAYGSYQGGLRELVHLLKYNGIRPAANVRGRMLAERERFEVVPDILELTRDRRSQISMTNHQRRGNMRGAFALRRAGEVTGREVLVVEDVYTTSATASECARVLRKAGASVVWVAPVARTLKLASKYAEIEPDGPEATVPSKEEEIPLAKAAGS